MKRYACLLACLALLTAGCQTALQSGIAYPARPSTITSETSYGDIPQVLVAGLELKLIAGSGKAGYKDGPAFQAEFNMPAGITKDQAGNLYVADGLNALIRKITPDGTVSKFAGSQEGVVKVGTLTETEFFLPRTVKFIPPNSLYVLDAHALFKVELGKDDVQVVATSAGRRGETQAEPPIEIDQEIIGFSYLQGQIYIGDFHKINIVSATQGKHSILEMIGTNEATTGFIDAPERFFKDGSFQEARFEGPRDFIFDKSGNILVADIGNHRIRKLSLQSRQVSTLTGFSYPAELDHTNAKPRMLGGYRDGKLDVALFNGPAGLETDSEGNIFVNDAGNDALRLIRNGQVFTLIKNIHIVGSYLENGTLYLTDSKSHQIYSLDVSKIATMKYAHIE